jgi:hypothetical protein
MKIRIAENELRFRVDAQDLKLLKEKKDLVTVVTISETCVFHGGLSVRDDLESPLITVDEYSIQLYLPKGETSKWLTTEENITLYKNLALPNSPTSITVEKDLPCKH